MVTGSYPPMMCGVGDYTQALVNSLRESGVDVRVVTTQIDTFNTSSETWVSRVMPDWRIGQVQKFLNIVEEFSPDIVHIQDPTQGYDYGTAPVLMIAAARLKKRMNIVWTWHEFPPETFKRRFLMFVLMALVSKAIVFVRHNFKSNISQLLSCLLHRKPFQFIPNASVIPKSNMDELSRIQLKESIVPDDKHMIVFFGFIYPNKGVEQLFDIADPKKHHLVLVGKLDTNYPYHQKILSLAQDERWSGHVSMLGFLESEEAAKVIKAADAVVLPYTEGAGSWNTSLHAATLQGTFVITTSQSQGGYDAQNNIFYAGLNDTEGMRSALLQYCGVRRDVTNVEDPWVQIARDHYDLYQKVLLSREYKD
jgi:glycosyltransferase involved in cell wall biosynthesis